MTRNDVGMTETFGLKSTTFPKVLLYFDLRQKTVVSSFCQTVGRKKRATLEPEQATEAEPGSSELYQLKLPAHSQQLDDRTTHLSQPGELLQVINLVMNCSP